MSDQVPTRQRPGPAAVRALGLWSALLLVSGHAAGADVTTDHDAPEALTLARALLVDEGLRQLCIHPASPTPDAASRAASGWRDRNASRVREAADRLARAYPFSPANDGADRAQAARAAVEARITDAFVRLRADQFPEGRGDDLRCAAFIEQVERGAFDAMPTAAPD